MAAEERKPLHLEGTVEHVMYCNAENGYTVLELDAGGTLITVVGEMGETEEGEQLSVDGEYTTHPRYGMQFRAQYWERKLPADALNIQRYLSSGAIKGIGSSLAKKIVENFGDHTLEIMEKEPTRLLEIRGISPKKCESIAAEVKQIFSLRTLMLFLAQYDIDVSDCTQQTFRCFNDFFTRQRVRTNDRAAPDELPAIADSKLTALPIGEDSVFTVKDVSYRLGELLADDALAERFLGGWCLIFRLSPDDYHRYAYPDTGTQEPTVRIPGVLHSVNPIAGSLGVYRRNARARTLLHTERFGDVVQMEVGAMLVGRICNHETGDAACARLQEKGYFEYGGSTVILLLEHGKFEPAADIAKWSARGIESKVKTGDPVGRRP